MKQVEELLDTVGWIHPELQVILEVDHSSGHLKTKEDGLNIDGMNLGCGGKQRKLRETVIKDDTCLGSTLQYIARLPSGQEIVYKRLEIGDIQHFEFTDNDLPPFFDCRAEKYNREMNAAEKDEFAKSYVAKQRKKKKDNNLEVDISSIIYPEIEGYVGKQKGIYQILIERGMYTIGKTKGKQTQADIDKRIAEGKIIEYLEDQYNAHYLLSSCSDFMEEKTILQELVESRGHILITSPKCHPELAGCGIEYSWGKIKMTFRREVNDTVSKNLHSNIVESIDRSMSLERVWKYDRKTRDYRRAYIERALQLQQSSGTEASSFEILEKMRKIYKTHRNIGEIEHRYISDN